MKRDLKGKRILVTGASSGIGFELVIALLRQGAKIVATARRAHRLEDLRDFVNSEDRENLRIIPGDLNDEKFRAQLIDSCHREFDGLDGLVNNAGAGAIGLFVDASPERLRQVMEIDFFSAVELTRLALPLVSQGSLPFIAVVGSVLGHRGVSRKSEYCAAKFAIRGWSESLRCELRQEGVSVIMISPSTTRSEFFASLLETAASEESRSIGSMSTQAVAVQIVKAIQRNKREVILSLGGKLLVFASRFFPKILDRFC